VYANHAAISPPSIAVKHAVVAITEDYMRRGVDALMTWLAQRARLKGRIGEILHASPADIALTQNTTRGISDVALSVPWKAGDRVVLFDGEFPANVTPWQRAAELFGLEVTMLDARAYVRDEDEALAALDEALARGARMVAVSLVQFQTGYRMPVEEISRRAHAAGAEVLVDAIQGVGVIPVDVDALGCDYLACGSHKWLMGLEGVGFVYAKQAAAERLRPYVAGWLSHDDPVSFLFEGAGHLRYDRPIRRSIDFLEGAAQNGIGCAALEASLDLILQLDARAIFEHVSAYLDPIEAAALELGFTSTRSPRPERRSGSLCLVPPAGVDLPLLCDEMNRLGVSCSKPDGYLRIAPHWPNALDEADQVNLTLKNAVDAVLGERATTVPVG
jgi:cysteine desulfurase / selenocysteine lyase